MRTIAAVAVAMLALQLPSYPAPFPREGSTKVLDNGRVVVWRQEWVPNRPTPMHEHAMDLVGVVLADGQVKVSFPDGAERVSPPYRPGDVIFQPRGMIHIEDSVGLRGLSMAIEIKNEAVPVREANRSAAEAFPREGARLVVDNARVAIWDYQWLPGRPVGLHIHNRDTVMVPVEAGDVRVEFRNGDVRTSRLVVGEALFFSGADAHREAASVGAPRAIVVELK
jgi:hypothetical protein